jgi:3-oxoacyl-[acyl-carrier protein] reductase
VVHVSEATVNSTGGATDSPSFGDLSGRRAVVTGSSSGIGRAIALEFAAAGADVVVHCRRSITAGEETVSAIRSLGRRSELVIADLGVSAGLDNFVSACWGFWGGIDIWVNNAGVDLLTTPEAKSDYGHKCRRLFEVDVTSTVLLSKQVGQRMRESGVPGAGILNIGWDQADRGMEGDSGELFSAAKNAIAGFSRSLACSLAPAIRVNCIAAGWIRTAWGRKASDVWQQRVLRETPLLRWGEPEDLARLARFLVSDSASFLTGQVINCNGGAVR